MKSQLPLFGQPENDVTESDRKTPKLIHADCLEAMREMEANSIDAIVTDPPYGLVQNKKGGSGVASVNLNSPHGRSRIGTGNGPGGFMGKEWDSCVPGVPFWTEALRVAKPGAHLVAFGGTRTYHRLACAIEDAGWEVRDCLSWLYGSGFPKSLDVSKAIDKAAGAERTEVIGKGKAGAAFHYGNPGEGGFGQTSDKDGGIPSTGWDVTAPATDAARQWQGWGTALKPAWEPIILARKPLVGTVAANVLAHGTGGINIDATRIETDDNLNGGAYSEGGRDALPGDEREGSAAGMFADGGGRIPGGFVQPSGRWPANVTLDEEAASMLDEQTGDRPSTLTGRAEAGQRHDLPRDNKSATGYHGGNPAGRVYADSGGASRFFYTAKASRRERGEGNTHPTVKPLSLMRWLVKLVTPPGGVILDPFAGSGTTLLAAQAEGFDAVGIEREAEYVEIARKRIEGAGDPK